MFDAKSQRACNVKRPSVGKLEGKIAVVTGGSSGIGLAVARRFVDEEAFVYVTGRRPAELVKAERLIERNVRTIQGDIADLKDLDRLYATVNADHPRIDVLVANAGVVELVPTRDATPAHFDKTFGVNARGTFFHRAKGQRNPGWQSSDHVGLCRTQTGRPLRVPKVLKEASKLTVRESIRP